MSARIRRWLPFAVLGLAAAPFVVAFARALDDGWRPLGDRAVTGVLTHDVLSTRTPLVGMPSTIKTAGATFPAHHPGPLLFWALAIPERLALSAPFGLLLGAVIVNIAAVVAIGVVARRVAGRGTALGALVIVVVLAWALGRQAIVDVWNPYLALFPMFALLVVAWSVFAGDTRMLWLVALLASFVAQAHILFVPLGVSLGVAALIVVMVKFVRIARGDAPWKRDAAWAFGSTAVVLLVAWSFPIFDQLAHSPGNLVDIKRSLSHQGRAVGTDYALRVLVQSIGVLPLFARQSASFVLVGRSWGELGALRIVSALLVLGLLVTGTVVAARRRDRVSSAAGCTALFALVVVAITIARLPAQPIDIVRYRLIEAWVMGAFAWFALGIMAWRLAPAPAPVAVRRALVGVGIALLIAIPIATAFSNTFDYEDTRLYTAVGKLASEAAPKLDNRGSYRLELQSDTGVLGPDVMYGVLRELLRRHRDVGVGAGDIYLSRSHTAGGEPVVLDLLVGKTAVASPPAGATLLAQYTAPPPTDLAQADESLRRYLSSRDVLSARGRAALASNPTVASLLDGHTDPLTLVTSGDVARLWAAGLLRDDALVSKPFRAYTQAHLVADGYTFALYLLP
jgi:hypothetical protein